MSAEVDSHSESLIAIYIFQEEKSSYYLAHLCCKSKMIDSEVLSEIYGNLFASREFSPNKPGPFSSLDEINQFAFSVCDHYGLSEVRILSAIEYNQVVESSYTKETFLNGLFTSGNVIENPDANARKGFLGKIFN